VSVPAQAIGAADCRERRQAARPFGQGLMAILFGERITDAVTVRSAMEKHELSAIDFKLIDDAFNALLQSNPEPVTANKIKDLRNMFHDAYTGWLQIHDEAA